MMEAFYIGAIVVAKTFKFGVELLTPLFDRLVAYAIDRWRERSIRKQDKEGN